MAVRRFSSWLFCRPGVTVPFALLALCLASYGWLASRLGFYWDDWFYAYHIHAFGPGGFQEAFLEDRPLAAGLYALTSSLLGKTPAGWQFFGIFTRWLSCLALWAMLRALWPQRLVDATAIALLFAVYPGFQQQYIAITYSNWFLVLAIFLTSLASMLWALRSRRFFWLFYLLSIGLGGYAMFVMEYFFGLELLRPLLLWMILAHVPRPARLRQVIRYWSPYLLVTFVFMIWRASYQTARGEVTLFSRLWEAPIATTLGLFQSAFRDASTAGLMAWMKVVQFDRLANYDVNLILRYVAVVVGVALAATLYLLALRLAGERLRRPDDGVSSLAQSVVHPSVINRRPWDIILLGAYALLVAGIPFWLTFLPLSLNFPRDRFTLSFMLGAVTLLYGLIALLPSRLRYQDLILAGVVIGLSAGVHYQNALTYAWEWVEQKNFFWQLAWRAPGLQPGTILLTTEVPFPYDQDNSLAAPLNWIYAPDSTSPDLDYYYYNVESHLTRKKPPLSRDLPLDISWRLARFSGSLGQSLFVVYRPGSCLKVIDPAADRSFPEKPRFFREALPLSRPELILPDPARPAHPPEYLFGPEPPPDWCYYFEKAELAVQQGDWSEAARLGDLALDGNKRFYRKNASEVVPFVQGYARTGQWDKAVDLSIRAYDAWGNMRLVLCELWTDLRPVSDQDTAGQAAFQQAAQALKCPAR